MKCSTQSLFRAIVLLLSACAAAAPAVFAQPVESPKEKTVTIHGVEIKRDTPFISGGYHYQLELVNRTNETMVVDIAFAFSNDEIVENFDDSIRLAPGESANRDWATKVRGTRNNTIVSIGTKKLLVRSDRQVEQERISQAEQLNQEASRKAAADYARQQKVGEDWQKQMRELAQGNRRASQARAARTPAEPVKFNVELVKLLLLDLDGQKPRPNLDPFSKTAQNFHWSMLIDAGLVDGASIKSSDGSVSSIMLKKITPDGRAFLAALKDEQAWKEVLASTAREGDSISPGRLKEIAAAVAKRGAPVK